MVDARDPHVQPLRPRALEARRRRDGPGVLNDLVEHILVFVNLPPAASLRRSTSPT